MTDSCYAGKRLPINISDSSGGAIHIPPGRIRKLSISAQAGNTACRLS